MKRFLTLLVIASAFLFAQNPPATLTAYSYTVSQSLFANVASTTKPQMLPYQVILFQVPAGTSATAGITAVPQGTNVIIAPTFTALSNLTVVNGWYEFEMRPSPVDATQPMTLTAPLVSVMPPPVAATQVN